MITTEKEPFYADWDEDTALWCVFSIVDEVPFAYSTWSCEETAESDARIRNELFTKVYQ